MVDKQDLELFLSEFPRYELSRIADDRGVEVRGRELGEYVSTLLNDEWTDEEVKQLVGRLQKVKQEGDPLQYFMCVASNMPDLEEFADSLIEMNPAEFDQEGNPTEGGYEINEVEDKYLEFRKWTVSEKRDFDRLTGNVKTYPKISALGVSIDKEEERVYIETNNYLKAKSIMGYLRNNGFEFTSIGHKDLLPETAKEETESFVAQLEQELEEVNHE